MYFSEYYFYYSFLLPVVFMHTLIITTTRSLFGFILFLILLLFGCATGPGYKYEYEELEINYNSIYEAVKPGTSISIKTKDASGIYIYLSAMKTMMLWYVLMNLVKLARKLK